MIQADGVLLGLHTWPRNPDADPAVTLTLTSTPMCASCPQAVAKGAKKQKVAAEEYATMAPEQWPVRPYLEKFVAPLVMEAMQVGPAQ